MLRWTANQRAGAFAIVPVDANGQLTLTNHSSGATTFSVDVVGYFREGAPSVAGMLDTLPAARVVNTTSVGRRRAPFPVTGRGGVAKAGVRAAVLIVTAETPAASGALVVYPGGTRPGTANVGFAAGHAASNVVLAPLSSSGNGVDLQQRARAVNVHVDVVGWVLAATEHRTGDEHRPLRPQPGRRRSVRPERADDGRRGLHGRAVAVDADAARTRRPVEEWPACRASAACC